MAVRLFLMFMCLATVISCKKDDNGASNGAKKISVTNVTLNNKTTTTQVITQALVGTLIRINGSGFATATAIYCNGVKVSVNSNFVTETNIIMTIPSTLPFGSDVTDTAVRNTIRIVTKYDDYKYKFTILGPAPVISSVSHTLPRVGESFTIYGTNLRDVNSITFPGNVVVTKGQFQLSTDFKTITLPYPAGASVTPGFLDLKGVNGEAFSYNYLNHYDGVFIKNFTADANKCYNYGSNISATTSAPLPQTGTGDKNPDYYRQIPATPTDVAVSATSVGGFHFHPDIAFNSVLQTMNAYVSASTSCNDLALQFDYYIPVQWSSGWIRVDLINGNANYRFDYAPWDVSGAAVPINMTGWQTATMPLSAFKALNGQTVSAAATLLKNGDAMFSFINNNYTDSGGASFAAAVIPSFQLSFGNFRIVPYVKGK